LANDANPTLAYTAWASAVTSRMRRRP
jgi:hypothetical protein